MYVMRIGDAGLFLAAPDRFRETVDVGTAAGRVERFAAKRIGGPIARPHQILCLGHNHRDHAGETCQTLNVIGPR
jgi:2-keto-4-pentenoate hydratase/2-oxohepta-3-ene-1,7-dioic acid hydratase in catechol pathway